MRSLDDSTPEGILANSFVIALVSYPVSAPSTRDPGQLAQASSWTGIRTAKNSAASGRLPSFL